MKIFSSYYLVDSADHLTEACKVIQMEASENVEEPFPDYYNRQHSKLDTWDLTRIADPFDEDQILVVADYQAEYIVLAVGGLAEVWRQRTVAAAVGNIAAEYVGGVAVAGEVEEEAWVSVDFVPAASHTAFDIADTVERIVVAVHSSVANI
jgi:hypothetical protein